MVRPTRRGKLGALLSTETPTRSDDGSGNLSYDGGGLYTAPDLALDDLSDVDTVSTPPADGDVLTFDSGTTLWAPAAPAEPTADAHIADTSDAHDASAISIADAGGYFTGTDVEAALQELGAGGGGGGGGVTVSDEGSPLTTAATTLDFVGAGVTASGSGATKTITIPGASSTWPPLDQYTIDGTYGDHFTGSSLDAKWTRRNYTSGAETYQVGKNGTYLRISKSGRAAGDAYFQSAPAGDWTIAMKYILRFFGSNVSFAWGLAVVDTNGTGVATCIYNSPNGMLGISVTTYSTYGGTFVEPGGTTQSVDAVALPYVAQRPVWVYLRKSGTSYYVAYSLDGEAWTPESGALTWAGTVNRFGMMDAPLGAVTDSTRSYVDVDWFNKIG